MIARQPATPWPAPPRIERAVINQTPEHGMIERIEDRTAAIMECAQRLTQGRVTIGFAEFQPQMGGMMPTLEQMSAKSRCIAIIRQFHDECLATPDDYPEAALAMRWAMTMQVPSAAPGWERYAGVIRLAMQTPRVLVLETTDDMFPTWRNLWDAVRAPAWKPRPA